MTHTLAADTTAHTKPDRRGIPRCTVTLMGRCSYNPSFDSITPGADRFDPSTFGSRVPLVLAIRQGSGSGSRSQHIGRDNDFPGILYFPHLERPLHLVVFESCTAF